MTWTENSVFFCEGRRMMESIWFVKSALAEPKMQIVIKTANSSFLVLLSIAE